ncbi:MAG TPA: hypothetical protein EYP08_04790 [Pyrodictiaceae archaeon]|nr:hypothetical protein [Pyrodictiaceae archaeon]
MEIEKYLEVGLLATKKAKEILLNYFEKNKNLKIDEKSKNDFVTQADKESEKVIINTILNFFPNHKIYAEESEHNLDKLKDGDIIWIIDPLDGTKNFIHHIPIFGTSIGVAKFSLKYKEDYYPFKKGYIKLLTGIINPPVLQILDHYLIITIQADLESCVLKGCRKGLIWGIEAYVYARRGEENELRPEQEY